MYREITHWSFVVIFVTSITLALVVPPAWVFAVPGMRQLLTAVADAVPATAGYIHSSQLGDVARVYFPFMLLLSPLFLVWTWQLTTGTFWKEQFERTPVGASFRLLAAALLVFLARFATFSLGGGQLGIIPWNESRIALALAGYIATGGAFFIGVGALARGSWALLLRMRDRASS